jgi:arginine utilization protein RocB
MRSEREDQPDTDWFDTVRRFTLRLVGIRSVSPGPGEVVVAREALALLGEGGLADVYTASGLDPIAGDPYGRANAYAFLRGASNRTLVLLGHIDTVGTADYGPLEPWALDPEALATRDDALAALTPGLGATLAEHPGDLMFGRGVADMKSGVAVNLAVMRRLAERACAGEPPPLSVVVLAMPDEENASAGVLQAVHFLLRLRAEHGLEYVGAINTDYTTARYPGDPHRYIYTGTIGKLLPSFLVIGREAHVSVPFDGLDANLLAAALIQDLSMNPELCDVVRGQCTPPPVTLHASDLKTSYDVQLPFATSFYLNVLTFTTQPDALLERLRERTTATTARLLAQVDAAERRWMRIADATAPGEHVQLPARSGVILTYAQLYSETAARLGEERVRAALEAEAARQPAGLDARERSLRLVAALWALGGRSGPAVVLYYSPPYYPHVQATPCALHDAARAVAAAHPEHQLVVEEFYPYISDMSYLRLDPGVDLSALTANMPQWQETRSAAQVPAPPGGYRLPLGVIRALDLPLANIGPYGWGVHQRGECALMSYSFGVLPHLIYETLQRLGEM